MDPRNALYNQLILDHNKKPRNFGKLSDATHEAEGLNPLCGDHLQLGLRIEGDRVESIGFQGTSCAICQASASIMTTQVKHKSVADARQLISDFRAVITGDTGAVSIANQSNRYFGAFSGISSLPSRVKCAVLPWHTLQSALGGAKTATTEGDADPAAFKETSHAEN
jgi:nitrogen fixation NifU-like protein